jgi:hypothetical protein
MPRALVSAWLLLVAAALAPLMAGDAPAAPATTTASPAAAAATPAAATAPPLPETLLLGIVKALQHDDFTLFIKALPADQLALLQTRWTTVGLSAAQAKSLDGFLTKYLAPGAVDAYVTAQKEAITGLDLGNYSQKLTMGGAVLPMILGNAGALTPAQQNLLPQVQQLLTDLGGWLPTSGLNDPAKVHQALDHVQLALKALGVTTSAQLHQVAFADLVTRLGPAHHELKLALAAFGINADALLSSLTATSVVDPGGDPIHRTLTVSFTAFAHPYVVALPIHYQDSLWLIDPVIVPQAVRNLAPVLLTTLGQPGDPAQP